MSESTMTPIQRIQRVLWDYDGMTREEEENRIDHIYACTAALMRSRPMSYLDVHQYKWPGVFVWNIYGWHMLNWSDLPGEQR